MLVGVAGLGGPIALTSDKTKALLYKSSNLSLKNVLFYDNQGKMIHKHGIEGIKERIVLLDWLKDELLLLLMESGKYMLIEPVPGQPTQQHAL